VSKEGLSSRNRGRERSARRRLRNTTTSAPPSKRLSETKSRRSLSPTVSPTHLASCHWPIRLVVEHGAYIEGAGLSETLRCSRTWRRRRTLELNPSKPHHQGAQRKVSEDKADKSVSRLDLSSLETALLTSGFALDEAYIVRQAHSPHDQPRSGRR